MVLVFVPPFLLAVMHFRLAVNACISIDADTKAKNAGMNIHVNRMQILLITR